MKLTANTFLALAIYLLTFTTAVSLTNITLPQNTTGPLEGITNAETDDTAKCKPRNGPCSVNQDCCVSLPLPTTMFFCHSCQT